MSYLDELSDIWEQVKKIIATKFPPSQVDLWFSPLKIHSYENNTIILSTDSEFKYSKIKEKYLTVIKEAFAEFFGFEQEVDIVFVGEPTSPEKIQRQLGIGSFNPLTQSTRKEEKHALTRHIRSRQEGREDPCPPRRGAYAPWRYPDPDLHARGHAGHRQGDDQPRA